MNTTATAPDLTYEVQILSYDESDDTFACRVNASFDCTIPAFLMPVIASETCHECADLPFDLVGKSFLIVQ